MSQAQRPGAGDSDSNAFSPRTPASISRRSFSTEPVTRRSSFVSAQGSIYQDAGTSFSTSRETGLSFADASSNFDDSSISAVNAALQMDPSGSCSSAAVPTGLTRSGTPDTVHSNRTSIDAPIGSRRRSYQRPSAEYARPISSLSRRSSTNVSEDNHTRLRDAATAAASRSSTSRRRRSVEIDQLAQDISRASTPHGFGSEDGHGQTRQQGSSTSRSNNRDADEDGSFIKRDGREKGSILPPAAFFAPKKPSARTSSTNILSPGSPGPDPRSTTPLSWLSATSPRVNPTDMDGQESTQEVLDQGTPNMTNYEVARSPSPWGLAASVHSLTSSQQHNFGPREGEQSKFGRTSVNDHRDPLSMPMPGASPQSVVRLMASTDPLLPARAIREANLSGGSGPTLNEKAQNNDDAVKSGDQEHRAVNSTKPTPADTRKSASQPIDPATATKKKETKAERNYRHHKGDNKFLFGGLLMTSGDNPIPFILSYALLLVLGGLFLGFEAPWLSRNISPAVVAVFSYIYLLAVVNMGVTAWKDPGVIPRNLDPDPPCVLGDSAYEDGRQPLADPEDPLAIPVQRILRIRNQTVKVKWCETCGTYRPPRSSHCRVCDNCVENIDHHCTFLNNCIGRRNYVPFMVFLTTSILSALMVVALTVVHLVLLTKPTTYRYPRGGHTAPGYDFRRALQHSPVSAILFLLCLGALGPVLTLFGYHLRLVALNRSTVEQIRINTAREYGEQKELEMDNGDAASDAGSVFGAADANRSRNKTSPLAPLLKIVGLGGPKYKDSNPFATRKMSKNVRNGLGWRSIHLESWIDRRGRHVTDTRQPQPRSRVEQNISPGNGNGNGDSNTAATAGGNGLEWKA